MRKRDGKIDSANARQMDRALIVGAHEQHPAMNPFNDFLPPRHLAILWHPHNVRPVGSWDRKALGFAGTARLRSLHTAL